jgi:hypothetical protein
MEQQKTLNPFGILESPKYPRELPVHGLATSVKTSTTYTEELITLAARHEDGTRLRLLLVPGKGSGNLYP